MNMCLCLCVARGASSKMNFMNWLESVIQGLTKYNCIVYHGSVRQHGFYHHMLMSDFLTITSVLSQAFAQWGRDCAANGFSCGVWYHVRGAGNGSMMFAYQAV